VFARRRFEFPHLVLLDADGSSVGVVQFRAVFARRQWIPRTGLCGHPRWPQWWVPFRVLRHWEWHPVEEDLPRLLAHDGDARLMVQPRGAKSERVCFVMPTGVSLYLRDADGEVAA